VDINQPDSPKSRNLPAVAAPLAGVDKDPTPNPARRPGDQHLGVTLKINGRLGLVQGTPLSLVAEEDKDDQ